MTDITATDPAVRMLPLATGSEVDIVLTSNTLRLQGTDGDHVVVRSHDGQALEGEVTVEADQGAIRIRDGAASTFRVGPIVFRTGRSLDLDVDVPRAAPVAVRTMSGDVKAVGIGGRSRWATASGDLLVQLDGGPASIESTSGDITVHASVSLELKARSVSGDLRITAPLLTALKASTTSGDIEIDAAFAGGSSHVISSVSGDVRLAAGSDVRLETQTVTGDVRASVAHRAEGGRGRRTIVMGDGHALVAVSTLSGDVTLVPAASVSPARSAHREPTATGAAAHAVPEPGDAAADVRALPSKGTVPATPPAPRPAEPAVVVAEAQAAANLIRPQPPAPAPEPLPAPAPLPAPEPEPERGSAGTTDRRDSARLDILRALERGELDVDAASRRLEALEEAGPLAFRRWC